MHDDAECGGGRFAGLARDDAVDVVRRCLAAVKDRLGAFVRRRHDLRATTTTSQWNRHVARKVASLIIRTWIYGPSIASVRSCFPTIIGIFLYTVYFCKSNEKNGSESCQSNKKKSLDGSADLVRGREILRGVIVQVWHIRHALEDRR